MELTRGAKDALTMLELDQARWQAVLDTARDAIVSIDPNGIVTLFNRSAEEIFGYAAAEVIGKNVSMLMASPYREEHDGYLESYQRTHVPKAIGRIRHVEARRKSGEVFPIELSVSEAHVGEQALYSAIIRDVTERRETEIALREAQTRALERERLADIGAITAKIAHDLGNPLSSLSMQAQLVLQRARRDGTQPLSTVIKPAEQLVAEVRRLEGLVREFLVFAREQRLKLEEIDLAALLTEVADLWGPTGAERRIAVSFEIHGETRSVKADAGKLRRVLDNLVKNGIEAIGEGPGDVRIAVSEPNTETLRISVEDSGKGIPDNVQIFRLFETTKEDGSGLGLAVSKQIMLAHGGDLTFARRSPTGTVFHVDLPRVRLAA